MHSLCPECDERLSPGARQCVCGWKNPAYFKGKDKAPTDPEGWRCAWTNGNKRCRYPGAISDGLRGDGRYLCGFHFRGGDASEAARITDESYEWDGKADSYLAMRFAEQNAARAKAGAKAPEERKGAYAATVFRDDAFGDEGVDGLPKKISALVPGLQPSDWEAVH